MLAVLLLHTQFKGCRLEPKLRNSMVFWMVKLQRKLWGWGGKFMTLEEDEDPYWL